MAHGTMAWHGHSMALAQLGMPGMHRMPQVHGCMDAWDAWMHRHGTGAWMPGGVIVMEAQHKLDKLDKLVRFVSGTPGLRAV